MKSRQSTQSPDLEVNITHIFAQRLTVQQLHHTLPSSRRQLNLLRLSPTQIHHPPTPLPLQPRRRNADRAHSLHLRRLLNRHDRTGRFLAKPTAALHPHGELLSLLRIREALDRPRIHAHQHPQRRHVHAPPRRIPRLHRHTALCPINQIPPKRHPPVRLALHKIRRTA